MIDFENSRIPRLFELINEKQLSQKVFADCIGVTTGNVTNWKKGVSLPTNAVLLRIAEFLGVSVDYLTGKSDERGTADTDSTVKVALFGGDTEVTDEMWDEMKNYAEYVKQKYKNKK